MRVHANGVVAWVRITPGCGGHASEDTTPYLLDVWPQMVIIPLSTLLADTA